MQLIRRTSYSKVDAPNKKMNRDRDWGPPFEFI